ncbi:MAG: glycosyltransferase [Aphanothece sp. CMT-3BRIN-NPC111]|jgi:hypothetical protein|nr:glycosyltransferase [Aphanothece sp. CMT-3BRIN-NPC111]
MVNNFTKKIFFYCCPPSPPESKKTVYQHTIVCLAEGLKSLGIPFYADRNFWQIAPDGKEYLFKHDPKVTPDDCSIVILHTAWFTYGNPIPEKLFHAKRNYITVYFESEADAKHAWKPEFRQFDFIFRTHYNRRFRYPNNFHPWAFGLSNRILRETEILPSFSERNRKLVVNFRLGHPIRKAIQEEFLPRLQTVLPIDDTVDSAKVPPTDPYAYLQWVQTDRRHYPKYYKRLRESAACACFGGLLINPWPLDAFGPSNLWDRIVNKFLGTFDSKPRRIMNWESWRFWEAMAAGCVAFHVDFDKYGVCLPVMPENWRHYIGIDLENMQAAIDRLAEEPEILEKISLEGRQWALEHYSPVPTAVRFLETVSGAPSTPKPMHVES